MLYRAKLVDYLGWMNQHDFVIYSLKPQEVPSYTTLFSPFGPFVWMSLIGSITMMVVVLCCYDYSYFGQGGVQFQGMLTRHFMTQHFMSIYFLYNPQISSFQWQLWFIRVYRNIG